MTDTLADSRTSSRMFTEGVPLVVEDVRRRPAAERAEMLADPGFGRYFTDRMFMARYRAGRGLVRRPADRVRAAAGGPERWRRCTTRSRSSRASRPTPSPTAASPPSGRSPTRPASSAAPSGWPCPRCPRRAFLAAVDALVGADRDWVPTGPDQTLYIRPYQMASEPFLGVRPAHEYLFLVIASPAGAYFPRGVQPVSVYLSEDYIRAAPGGTGDVKCAGNYAASLLAQEQAIDGRLRPGRLARRGREALRRGDGRDEPVLRPRLRRRRRAGHPRAHRHAAARHHPRLADRRWPASSATRSPSGGSPSTSGGRAWPTARSPRPSPAAPPRSSRRSARSRRAPATSRSATARPAR